MKRKPAFISHLLLALCGWIAAPAVVQANTQEAPDESFARHLEAAARVFGLEHGGRAPASWAEMQTVMGDPAKATPEKQSQCRRYALLQPPVRFTFGEGSDAGAGADILLMMRRPFREVSTGSFPFTFYRLRPPRRYVIVRSDDGTFDVMRMREERIQEIFRGRESLLPPPDTEPMRPWELSARFCIAATYALAVLALLLLARLMRRMYRYSITASAP